MRHYQYASIHPLRSCSGCIGCQCVISVENIVPLASNAQMMRAFLLASATAAMFLLHLFINLCSQLSGSALFSVNRMTARAPWTSKVRRQVSPCLLMPSNVYLLPLEYCLSTSHSHAANCCSLHFGRSSLV